jgi:hypothetical protein
MAITSLDDYIASNKQLTMRKATSAVTSLAAYITDMIAAPGLPGGGVLAGTSTTAGVIQTASLSGYSQIATFASSYAGYISRFNAYNSVASNVMLVDVLWKAGPYTGSSTTALTGQPTWETRIPNGTDYRGLEIWMEGVTASASNFSVQVGFVNQDGVATVTSVYATGAILGIGRCNKIPYSAGSSGVQMITTVVGSLVSTGTFNILVVRPLLVVRIPVPYAMVNLDMFGTGMPRIYDTSALALFSRPDSTSSGLPEIEMEISSK